MTAGLGEDRGSETLDEMRSAIGETFRLSFEDGQVVIGEILSVTPDEPGGEIVYILIEVVEPGTAPVLAPGATVVADCSQLSEYEMVAGD